jgi:urea transport system permease protein
MNLTSATRLLLAAILLLLWTSDVLSQGAPEARKKLSDAVLEPDLEKQKALVRSLGETGDDYFAILFEKWKLGQVFIHEGAGSAERIPFILEDVESSEPSTAIRIDTGGPLLGGDGKPMAFKAADLKPVDTTRGLRTEMKNTADLLALGSKDVSVRAQSAATIGMMRKPANIEVLQKRLEVEDDKKVIKNLREGIAVSRLASGDREQMIIALKELGEICSVNGRDDVLGIVRAEGAKPESEQDKELYAAARIAITSIDNYLKLVDIAGTAFRGLSLGSVLLIVALGLAITFGLMGVINMAHGEMIAIGAYATYLTEKWMTAAFGADGFGFEIYFVIAIPFAFLSAAAFGALLERGIIQFLYKRPLESLLATWGVSLIIQQSFRLIFGASNRQVNSPSWMMGSFEVAEVTLGFNRLFVILFAILIVFGTWLLMTKTPVGLCIRSVMQNPQMAACMGIRTSRVRMLTFAFGSGLAGLAGAFLSQIGNVGPALGQSYIVDSFMVVVAGGAGNLIGTVVSALTIGLFDQVLQPFVGPVMGKVSVLVAIILFLQWRPGGLFPTKSRSLD